MKILVIDDDRTVCSSLKLLLSRKGYSVDIIHQPIVAIDKIKSFKPDVILLDMNFTIDTSGRQGIKLLKLIREQFNDISVILMTGWATVQLAVEGMKLGAKDFIAKPWDNKELLSSIDNILKLHHRTVKFTTAPKPEHQNIIGESSLIVKVLDLVERVAITDASVLITGESGTGKELIAEAIHQKSKRKEQPFVKVNLGGVPNSLFESEMFGHKKGAFTGAHSDREGRFSKAHKGTIFLDEIGELGLDSQVKMLRVLQEKVFEKLGTSNSTKIDVRVISATNRELKQMSDNGTFREDLYYRINLLHIHLPPLRERSDDIPVLTKYFIKNLSELYNVNEPFLMPDTFKWLSQQEYKGNIRQLKNIIERTFLLNLNKKELTMKDFLPCFEFSGTMNKSGTGLNLELMEIEMIKKSLTKYNHSISSASRALGITRSSLYRRLEKYNIPHEPKI
jgi:DNA-binding NtrC family response regulator